MTTTASRSVAGSAARGASRSASRPPREDRLEEIQQRLATAVAELAYGDAWQRMLRAAALFHTYSSHNVLLITAQCPHAQAVAGFTTWKQLDRHVRQGEKGIAILAPVLRRTPAGDTHPDPDRPQPIGAPASGPSEPGEGQTRRRLSGFRVVHVFDVSQTDGAPLPEQPAPVILDGPAPPGLWDGLAAQVRGAGYTLTRGPLDLPHPGLAGANGVTNYFDHTVTVRPDLPEAQACKTLAHELGHVLLHEPLERPSGFTREQGEVEAESVAHVVAAAHGFDTTDYTVPYVTGWSGGDPALLQRTADRVLTTARHILASTPPPPTFTLPDGYRRDTGRQLESDRARTVERQPALTLDPPDLSNGVTIRDDGRDR